MKKERKQKPIFLDSFFFFFFLLPSLIARPPPSLSHTKKI